jgi:membrane-associated phospholipid phosphatase
MATNALIRVPAARPVARSQAPATRDRRSPFPILDGEDGDLSARLALALGRDRPKRTFLVGLLLAFVAIAAISIALGLLVTDVLLPRAGVASADGRFVRWLTHSRSSGLTDASLIGSMIAGGVVLPILAGLTALAAALVRQWRVVGFLVFSLALEAGVYRATTLVVHRQRPDVHRLEGLPANASYYSGHTAAAIAVYCGIALLLTSRIANRAAQVAIWAVAIAIPSFVALSRMYRGMHHPLDIAGGVVVGSAVVAAMVLICRAAGHAAAAREAR